MIYGAADEFREAEPGIEPAGRDLGHGIPQKPGPGGSLKPSAARRTPALSAYNGSCGRGLAAGPEVGCAPRSTSNVDW